MQPVDVKTYTTMEARAEWDGARESKRRMFLARIGQRDSNLASMSWDEFSTSERAAIHAALNEDFISPVWYINTKGERINIVAAPTLQKTPEQMADEEGEQHWDGMSHHDRFNALLQNGIGHDAEHGQYARWSTLSRELRDRLIGHFATASAVVVAVETRRQLELF